MAKRAASKQESGHYRMSELVDQSGATREMIKYYLRDGLLPPAKKPRRNLSLYSDQHVRLIALIQRFQEQTKLSLGQIAEIFAEQNHDPQRLEMALLSGRFSQQSDSSIVPLGDARKSRQGSLTFDDAFIAELYKNGLLDSDALVSSDDEKIATLLWNARDAGIDLSLFAEARKHLVALAELQINSLINSLPVRSDYSQGIELHADADRIFNRWMIADKTQLLRRQYQQILDDTEQDVAHSLDAIYLPSEVFRKRFGVDATIAGWRQAIAQGDAGPERQLEYAAATVLLADFATALEFCGNGAAPGADAQRYLAIQCVALSLQKRMVEAGDCFSQLQQADQHSTWSFIARLLYLLLQAAEVGALADASEMLGDALVLYQRALVEGAAGNAEEALEQKLLRGRACVMFSKWIPPDQEAIQHLQDMLSELDRHTAADLGLPNDAIRVVYQIYSHFYLARLYDALADAEQARGHYEQVVMLDPASNFGEYAYLRLAG